MKRLRMDMFKSASIYMVCEHTVSNKVQDGQHFLRELIKD